MASYVLGFWFNADLSRVTLIQKERPAWQKGRWNGVGGHLESGETPQEAMVREFAEEAGVLSSGDDWVSFGRLHGEGWMIYLFAGTGPLNGVQTQTDEEVRVFHTADVIHGTFAGPLIGNIRWLVQMAMAVLSGDETCKYFDIEENMEKIR